MIKFDEIKFKLSRIPKLKQTSLIKLINKKNYKIQAAKFKEIKYKNSSSKV